MALFRKTFITTLLISLLVACSIPGEVNVPVPPNLVIGSPLIIQAPDGSTPTATPFQPELPTPTYLPTDMPTPVPTKTPEPVIKPGISKTWADYPGPTVWPDINLPAPMGILPQPKGQTSILLMGSDQRPEDGGFRTDTLLLVTLNPADGTANITSFPRDLYVYIPGWTVNRINTAHAHGGWPLTQLTFEYNFGVHPDHFILVNFQTFKDTVDNLKGLDVHVGQTLTDQREGYGDFTVHPGVVHMNGEMALWYVRARYTTSDFDRGRRQQEVLQALFVKLLSLNAIARAPQLYDSYRRNVTTDLKLEDVTPWLPMAAKLSDTSRIHHYYIGPQQVYSWTNTYGAMVLVPVRDACLEVMRQALNSPQK